MIPVQTAAEEFDGKTVSVALARRFVRDTLAAWAATDRFEWRATTVISELATNAVLHARTSFAVSLTLESDRLTIEVRDGSARLPKMRRYDNDATTGRGMRLVSELCATWLAESAAVGKVVRCEIEPSDDERPRAKADTDIRDDTTITRDDTAVLPEQPQHGDETTAPQNRVAA